MTSGEASTLANTTFGAGKESTTGNGGNICTYGSQTLNVFMVLVAQASDATTANAEWSQEEAKAQAAMAAGLPAGIKAPVLADAPGIGDRAAVASGSATISGHTINMSAIYILKGATFLTYSDAVLDNPAPTLAALTTQATVSLSRIP